jgi:hypothetical protein
MPILPLWLGYHRLIVTTKLNQILKENGKLKLVVEFTNSSTSLAFAMNPKLLSASTREPILPIFWQDNYFSLLPGEKISVAGYKDARWHPIHRMPATVLEILQEDGVYPNLYFGKNADWRKFPRIYTSRTGGIARPSKRPPANPTRSNFRASTIAPKSGSTARRSPTTSKSSACMPPTN